MKNYFLKFVVFCTLASCSDDNASLQDNAGIASFTSHSKIQERTSPENNANPFDRAGKIHNQVLEAYYALPLPQAQNIPMAADSLAKLNADFNTVKTPSFGSTDPLRVNAIAGSSFTTFETTVGASQMSTYAKASFIDFAEDLMLLYNTEDDYAIVHSFIISYEQDVLADALLNAADKKTILVSTSISRHAAYVSKKKPKKNTDPEWDLMIGHLVGSVEGAGFGMAESITLSLSVGITDNSN